MKRRSRSKRWYGLSKTGNIKLTSAAAATRTNVFRWCRRCLQPRPSRMFIGPPDSSSRIGSAKLFVTCQPCRARKSAAKRARTTLAFLLTDVRGSASTGTSADASMGQAMEQALLLGRMREEALPAHLSVLLQHLMSQDCRCHLCHQDWGSSAATTAACSKRLPAADGGAHDAGVTGVVLVPSALFEGQAAGAKKHVLACWQCVRLRDDEDYSASEFRHLRNCL